MIALILEPRADRERFMPVNIALAFSGICPISPSCHCPADR
ncbi:hypothetical protein [Bradyrhizobium sp. CCBAU 11357]|nr:hypothetical protein [Bradyrhizobium sp. CCBAU 11357]